jgi:Fic family protein
MTKKIIVLPEQSKIYGEILNLASNPISRKKIQNKLSLSHQQLRRYTAELIDKGLLHSYKGNDELYVAIEVTLIWLSYPLVKGIIQF